MPPDEMSIEPQFITHEALRIRYVASPRPAAEPLMLLSPWPESLYAFAAVWPHLSQEFSLVALDLPGFGQSQGRRELMGPRAMADFVVGICDGLGLDRPHVVGPDVGTGAVLFAAATHPDAFQSVIVGAGAATFPLHVDGALKAFIDAGSIEDFRGADPAEIIRQVVSAIRNYVVPDAVADDYVQSYAGQRFVDSIAYVRNYPTDLAALSPLLADITTPVQIIVGRDDPYGLADDAQLLHEQLPHSRLDVFDCGHNARKEDAARYADVVAEWVKVASQKV